MLKVSNKQRTFVQVTSVCDDSKEVVLRPAQHYFRLVKAGIIDGVSSATGLYDDVPGRPAEVFDPQYSKLDLANMLVNRGGSFTQASKVAEKGIE